MLLALDSGDLAWNLMSLFLMGVGCSHWLLLGFSGDSWWSIIVSRVLAAHTSWCQDRSGPLELTILDIYIFPSSIILVLSPGNGWLMTLGLGDC